MEECTGRHVDAEADWRVKLPKPRLARISRMSSVSFYWWHGVVYITSGSNPTHIQALMGVGSYDEVCEVGLMVSWNRLPTYVLCRNGTHCSIHSGTCVCALGWIGSTL